MSPKSPVSSYKFKGFDMEGQVLVPNNLLTEPPPKKITVTLESWPGIGTGFKG